MELLPLHSQALRPQNLRRLENPSKFCYLVFVVGCDFPKYGRPD